MEHQYASADAETPVPGTFSETVSIALGYVLVSSLEARETARLEQLRPVSKERSRW